MVDSSQNKISFNITSRLNELKEKEKSELSSLRDINNCRLYIAEKLNMMNMLRINELELEKFGDSVIEKEEIEIINKIEEFQRRYFENKKILLPLSILSVLGFMQICKHSLAVKTFYENISSITPIFAGTYFVGNALMYVIFRSNTKNYEKILSDTLEKARLHSNCMMLSNNLKYDPDRHLI